MTDVYDPGRHPVARAAGALLAYIAVLAAIPITLWALSGNPIPKTIPSWEQIQFQWRGIQAQPSQAVPYVLRGAADLLWIVWAYNVIWFAAAMLWALVRLPSSRMPSSTPALTPSVALRALTLGTLLAAQATVPHTAHAQTVATAPYTPTPARNPSPAPATARERLVHVVEPGDSLWDLAQHYYRNGEQWHRIYQANKGAAQPDGGALNDPDLILPGWRLVIPGVTAPTATPVPGANLTPRPATPPPGIRPATGPSAPSRASGTAHGGHAPAPVRGGSDRPHTVGYELPDDAGYTGITLLAAIAAAVAILRTRNRRHGRAPNHDIPDLAQHLAAVHSAAQSAAAFDYRADEHPGQDPPPLATDPVHGAVIAASADGKREIPFDGVHVHAPIALTGPGAPAAARHFAISALATDGHPLLADPALAASLPGTDPAGEEPDTNTPAGGQDASEPGPHHTGRLTTNILDLDDEGTVRAADGPDADTFTGTRLHNFTEQAASDLAHTLTTARPADTPTADESDHDAPNETVPEQQDEHPTEARTLTDTPLILRLLGQPEIIGPEGRATRVGTEQAVALLTLLALHPDGIHARTLRDLEWPDATDKHRAHLAVTKAVGRVRAGLSKALGQGEDTSDIVLHDRSRQTYQLNPALITSDIALAQRLTTQAETTPATGEKARLLAQAANLYQDTLAVPLDAITRDWLTTARYNALNDAAHAHLHAAELFGRNQPTRASAHTRQAINLTPDDPETITRALHLASNLEDPHLAHAIYRRHTHALRENHERPNPAIADLARDLTTHTEALRSR